MPGMSSSDSITPSSGLRAIGSFFWELIKVFLVAIVIIVPIRYFLIQPFFVRGASMEPNFLDGEYLVIDELSYRFREPRRGEVIVFRFPENPSQFFIKRIIGLPGDTVTIQSGQVSISNAQYRHSVLLDESPYLAADARTSGHVSYQLGPDDFFVLGDNRAASSDSRNWGKLERDLIVGRVWVRAFPLERLGLFAPQRPGFIGT